MSAPFCLLLYASFVRGICASLSFPTFSPSLQASSGQIGFKMHEVLQTGPPPGKESTSPPTIDQDHSETNTARIRRRPQTGLQNKGVNFLSSLVVVVGLWYLLAQCFNYISGSRRGRVRRLADGVSDRIENSYKIQSCFDSKFPCCSLQLLNRSCKFTISL